MATEHGYAHSIEALYNLPSRPHNGVEKFKDCYPGHIFGTPTTPPPEINHGANGSARSGFKNTLG